jgi:hypothetical protein
MNFWIGADGKLPEFCSESRVKKLTLQGGVPYKPTMRQSVSVSGKTCQDLLGRLNALIPEASFFSQHLIQP